MPSEPSEREVRGLTSAEAAARLARVGPNALPERPPESAWRRFLRQFASPLVYILLFALAFDLGLWLVEGAHGWPIEVGAIGLILLFNAALGMYQEQRSEAAMARLKALGGAQAWTLRDGQLTRLPTAALVPGDWVRLEAGDRVPADGALTGAHGVLLDESLLTGESLPVEKGDGAEAFSGTLVVRGKTYLEITRTGATSAMGRLATMLGDIRAAKTPLERRVDQLGRQIARWVLTLAAVIGLLGVMAEGLARAPQMFIFAVALAVAAVPEGLPAVLTVALALGVERMARHKAVVRRLSAVEALGSVTVIATDKTGTLTENRMEVRSLDAADLPRALAAIVLANDADLATGAGDPLELGLLRYAEKGVGDLFGRNPGEKHTPDQGNPPISAGFPQLRFEKDPRPLFPRVDERPFDSAWKFSRVTVLDAGREVSYIKGASEVVFRRSVLTDAERESWREKADAYAREGFRVLALAWAEGNTEENLTLLGLALFWDPPRAEVPGAVATALAAGIRVVMITGDHPATALAVAHLVGIPGVRVLTGEDLDDYEGAALAEAFAEVNVFARVRPEQKLQIVEGLQAQGQIVAMTGDGVNDAPALKRSEVGIAMGRRGSDVSREVADIVLLDDNFATIVRAIDEGRGIYENIQKFLRFLFSTNLSEVLLVASGALLAFWLNIRDDAGVLMLPLTAAQILWINLLTDGLPALALAFDRTPGVMQHPPRPPASPLLDRPSMRFVVAAGSMKALLALGILGLVPWFGYSLGEARAATFHFMAIGQLLLTYPARHTWMHPLPNAYLLAAVVAGIAIQVAAAVLPAVSHLLGHAAIPLELWGGVFGGAVLAWGLAEAIARVAWRDRTRT